MDKPGEPRAGLSHVCTPREQRPAALIRNLSGFSMGSNRGTFPWDGGRDFREGFGIGGRRVRDRTAARNLAILCKVAINLISHGRTAQISMRARRKQAAWNDAYMLSLLAG